jgi:hypothetical protein
MHVGWGCHRLRRKFSVIQRASCHQRHPRPHPPAPRRLHGFYYVIPGGAWATLARTLDDPSSSDVFGAIQPSRFSNGFRARGSGMKRWPLRGRKEIATPLSRRKTAAQASQSRRLRSSAARRTRRTAPHAPSIGTVPPAPCPDSPALQTVPLRSTNPLRRLRGAFRCVPTAANCRDRPQIGRTQSNNSRMSRGSARHEQAIARDASHGQDTAIRREAPPVAEDEQ